MSTATLAKQNTVSVIKPTAPAFFDPSKLPWTPWVMDGTYFKLLAVDVRSGGFTMLLKVDPDIESPPHYHIGNVEGIVLEGEFGYGDDRGAAGAYICEHGGVVHQPDSPGGTVMFAIGHGPIVGYNPDGSIAVVVDAKYMMNLAREAGAADHIDANFHV